jgi:hypothetical protein
MSTGQFKFSKYEDDDGNIHPIRIQPETELLTLGAANAPPAGTVDDNTFIRVSGSPRAYGLKARWVSFRFTDASPPGGYKPGSLLRLPILNPTVYDGIIAGATTGTYQTGAIIAVGKGGESGRDAG